MQETCLTLREKVFLISVIKLYKNFKLVADHKFSDKWDS